MYGAAIGDALGSAFEFIDAATIHRTLGTPFVSEYRSALPGSLLHPRKPGRPTDDTAMALCVASAIVSGEPLTAEIFARRFLEDLERGKGRFADMFCAAVQAARRHGHCRAWATVPIQRRVAIPRMVGTERQCASIRSDF
jgi:ADP-ribosylglycohydrolase